MTPDQLKAEIEHLLEFKKLSQGDKDKLARLTALWEASKPIEERPIQVKQQDAFTRSVRHKIDGRKSVKDACQDCRRVPTSWKIHTIDGQFCPECFTLKKFIRKPITCILTSHNKPHLCYQAIDSVVRQNLQDWQLIVIDSGTLFEMKGYFEMWQSRIHLIKSPETEDTRKHNAIAPWCYNLILDSGIIEGEMIYYLCDDDILYPNCFQTFVDAANKSSYEAFYASQDYGTLVDKVFTKQGERRATKIGGLCAGHSMDCFVDQMQFCHRKSLLAKLDRPYWNTSRANEQHSDGIFMEKIGSICPILNLDIKVSCNRKTPISTYQPCKG